MLIYLLKFILQWNYQDGEEYDCLVLERRSESWLLMTDIMIQQKQE